MDEGRHNPAEHHYQVSRSKSNRHGRVLTYAVCFRYYLQFEARMGMRIYSDVAIDDFSLSPECFGLNIPAEHLQGYNYWDPRIGGVKQPHKDFFEKSCKC